ncbi:hypothetical protein NE236_21870 [Actinoallomurus purpureus]|uniref:DUF6745 domain-containing protein n=1 Tax=Actinoallomurus purpureus TaxID=478114 RepID=UPI002092E56F|nr:hypothetical protein [Actinoallomurus purpureus]MCO6007629.1 hypothetical protein [Actinoallomurus purpureus]
MSALGQREAAEIREEWLGRLLSALPADRPAAEAAISELYRLIGLGPPRFHWVPSPVTALTTVPPGVRLRPSEAVERLAEWPVPNRLRALRTRLCLDLDAQARRVDRGLYQHIHGRVRILLERSFNGSLGMVLRAAHDPRERLASIWYDALGISWIANYDALRRVAGLVLTREQERRFDLWATLAGSCGWWWPREQVCVVSERPVAVRIEVRAGDGEVCLHCADGPAVRYADGWEVHAWHGTRVPSWVIDDPSVERITRESNVEVRRCAIERIGWASYVDQAGLRLLTTAPDPGNPGSELRLYDMREDTRVLLAVNGSVERDGHRRRYGLTVPGFLDDPIAAAGWTYGLSAQQYSLLVRRT